SRRVDVRSMDDLAGLPTAAHELDERHVTIRLRRDAGTFIFEGEREGKDATGNVRFERDESFAALGAGLAGREVTPAELTSLAIASVKREDVEELRNAGEPLAPRDLVRLRDQGVSGAYLHELAESGRPFALDDAIKLRNNGVKGEYVKGLHDAG